jgi:hypothetical protein
MRLLQDSPPGVHDLQVVKVNVHGTLVATIYIKIPVLRRNDILHPSIAVMALESRAAGYPAEAAADKIEMLIE